MNSLIPSFTFLGTISCPYEFFQFVKSWKDLQLPNFVNVCDNHVPLYTFKFCQLSFVKTLLLWQLLTEMLFFWMRSNFPGHAFPLSFTLARKSTAESKSHFKVSFLFRKIRSSITHEVMKSMWDNIGSPSVKLRS